MKIIPLIDAPITDVVLFRDNACRTTRTFSIKPTETGVQTLIIEGITRKANGQSVRVTGTGPCTILEVNTEIVKRMRSDFDQTQMKEIGELMSELKGLQVSDTLN